MRAIAAFALLATLAACASAPPADTPGPLKAELTEDEFGARVHLSAAAYVAVFRVTPGVGSTLVYPRDEADAPLLRAGNNLVISRTTTRGGQALAANSNTYLYLVASKEPLEVEQFQVADRGVEDVIGTENATSHDLRLIMESLDVALMSTDATVAGPWTSDVLMPWERLARSGSVGSRGRNGNGNGSGSQSGGQLARCPQGGEALIGATNGACVGSALAPGVPATSAERAASRPNAGQATGGSAGRNGGSSPE